MNEGNIRDLAIVRFERACELLDEAEKLLDDESFKSANNRAYYAAEKAVKAALAVRGKDSESHVGVLRTFNMEFIYNPSDWFSREELSILQDMERIRTTSDYDDFYVAYKAECVKQVENAKHLIEKVRVYLANEEVLENK